MKHKAVGFRLIVKPDEVELKTASGIVIATNEKMERNATDKGTVLDIGPEAFRSYNRTAGFQNYVPWCKVGDKITYAKYAGKWVKTGIIKDDGKEEELLIINDEDVTSVVDDSSDNVASITS